MGLSCKAFIFAVTFSADCTNLVGSSLSRFLLSGGAANLSKLGENTWSTIQNHRKDISSPTMIGSFK